MTAPTRLDPAQDPQAIERAAQRLAQGQLVARYSPASILRQKLPWWLASKYDIRLVDESDDVIASTTDRPRLASQAWYRVPMGPTMPQAWLELTSLERITPWWQTIPMVLMGGSIVVAQMGDPNASIPTPQPVYTRPMFGAFGRSVERNAVVFVSQAAQEADVRSRYGLAKATVAVQGCREIGKRDMRLNDATPQIEVHPETYEVRADGVLLTCEPASKLPMAQRYFLF